jgi:gliding motility-associated-like protein
MPHYLKELLVSLFFIFLFQQVFGQVGFPYCENFEDGSPQSTTVLGGSARLVDGVLRLTDAIGNQNGYVYINIPFSSSFGIKCSFEYFSYGGTGADGLVMFLFDANTPVFSPGGFGGSLGYARRNTEPGLTGAYMGVGFDSFGNFGNTNEGRTGGFQNPSTQRFPNAIVIRGPGSGFTGYPFISGRLTNAVGPLGLPEGQQFPLSSGGVGTNRVIDPDKVGYRQVFLNLEPVAAGIGYLLTVEMQVTTIAGNPRMVKIMDKEPYPYAAPGDLKIGFAASTGGSTNIHEIRNLIVEVSNTDDLLSPSGVDILDRASCEGQNNTYQITDNEVVLPNANSVIRCIRFYKSLDEIDMIDDDICLQGACDPARRVATLPQGVFTADEEGGGFTFFPNFGYRDQTVEIFYTITDTYGKQSSGNALKLLIKESPEQVFIYMDGSSDPVSEKRLCLNESVNLEARGGEMYVAYEWYLNGEQLPGAITPSLNAASEGTYTVVAFNTKGCPTESSDFVLSYPGFPEINLLADPIVGCTPGQTVDVLSYVAATDNTLFDYRLVGQGQSYLNERIEEISISGKYFLAVKHKDLECWSEEVPVEVVIQDRLFEITFEYEVDGTGIRGDEGGGIFLDDPIRFIPALTDPVEWLWDFGDGNSSQEFSPVHVFNQKGDFPIKLTATNSLGCQASYELVLPIKLSYRVMVPTGFTPDLSENRYFWPKFKGIKSLEMFIFNLWGNMVYQTTDINASGWDGTLNGHALPAGQYVYRINMISVEDESIVKSGKILLIR